MNPRLQKIEINNFRCLEHVEFDVGAINILFGPNGSGKSTILDAIWFVRDCAIRGVDIATAERSHGIGILWDRAEPGAPLTIKIESILAAYEVTFGFSSGRIDPFVGEKLYSKKQNRDLIKRTAGSDKVLFYHPDLEQDLQISLREPNKLALTRFLDLSRTTPDEATEIDGILRYTHYYHSRTLDFYRLRKIGSDSHYHIFLYDRVQNLWSVLRNLKDRRDIDDRYETIMQFMRKSFPAFENVLIEQTAPEVVYGNFIETERREPIKASGASDGHLQLLTLLTTLFSEGRERESIILLDEPEISLHPFAISVFADAVQLATEEWGKQIFIATHSPVLISQFSEDEILATEISVGGQTIISRVSEIDEISDLLKQYAAGSLYMAELIAPQSQLSN